MNFSRVHVTPNESLVLKNEYDRVEIAVLLEEQERSSRTRVSSGVDGQKKSFDRGSPRTTTTTTTTTTACVAFPMSRACPMTRALARPFRGAVARTRMAASTGPSSTPGSSPRRRGAPDKPRLILPSQSLSTPTGSGSFSSDSLGTDTDLGKDLSQVPNAQLGQVRDYFSPSLLFFFPPS